MKNHELTLGDFRLVLEPGGKLLALEVPGGHQVLHQTDYRFDCGGGRTFVPAGWDECFPTIDPWGASPVMGELIGSSPALESSADRVRQAWTMPRYRAERVFRSAGVGRLQMGFEALNLSDGPLEFLWASHALFALDGLRQLTLPDGQRLHEFGRDGSCRKFFVRAGSPVVLEGAWGLLRMETDQPHWGIWLNRGGWPAGHPAGFGCIGIEATNSAGEVPGGARLAPRGVFRGSVTLTI